MNVALMDGPKDQHSESITDSYDWVRKVHTLGPAGTNCEKAALKWAALKCKKAELALHESMERAAEQGGQHKRGGERALDRGRIGMGGEHRVQHGTQAHQAAARMALRDGESNGLVESGGRRQHDTPAAGGDTPAKDFSIQRCGQAA